MTSRRKITLIALSLLLVVSSTNTPAKINYPLRSAEPQNGVALPIRAHRQNTPVWCWAATIAMVVEYIRQAPIEDCEVLSLYDRAAGGPGRCCEGDRRCQRGGQPGETELILSRVFNVHGMSFNRPFSFEEVATSLNNGNPMIVWIWSGPQTAHAVVIAGYNNQGMLLILDPLYGPLNVPYTGLLRSSAGEWRNTIMVNSRS